MSTVSAVLAAHNQACADRNRARDRMGSAWRDAAARIVEARYLDPLETQDGAFAGALADLAQQLDQAERLIND